MEKLEAILNQYQELCVPYRAHAQMEQLAKLVRAEFKAVEKKEQDDGEG